jgi:hypothetical protein
MESKRGRADVVGSRGFACRCLGPFDFPCLAPDPVTGGQFCVLLLTGKETGNRRFLPLTNPGIGCLSFLVPDLAGRGLVWFCVEL